MGYQQRWKKNNYAERFDTGLGYRPLNQDKPADEFDVGRVWVIIWPTGNGPLYRFRVDVRFRYPGGYSEYFPDDSLRELQRAVRKARRRIRRLERIQHRPMLVRIVCYRLGW